MPPGMYYSQRTNRRNFRLYQEASHLQLHLQSICFLQIKHSFTKPAQLIVSCQQRLHTPTLINHRNAFGPSCENMS